MSPNEVRFQDWYVSHAPAVRNYLFRLAGASVLDDLVQETFLKVWRHMDSFDGRSNPRTWIHRIAHNVAIDRFRDKFPELHEAAVDRTAAYGPSPELADLVTKALGALSETLRPTFTLFYHQGFSVIEVAETLEIPEGTVKTRLHHGREKFAEFLRQNGVEYEF